MPIVLNKSKVAELGGKYNPKVVSRAQEPAPAPAPAPVVERPAPPLDLSPVVGAIKESQQSHERQITGLADRLERPAISWTATIRSRDQHGRILKLDFTPRTQP